MRRQIITLSLLVTAVLVVGTFSQERVMHLQGSHMQVGASAASDLGTEEDYGRRLGSLVLSVVGEIRSRVPHAEITYTDILAIMCAESGALIRTGRNITSHAGARGLTQVMPSTLKYYAESRAGGFYLPYQPEKLYSNPWYSITAGGLIFNHHLMNYDGDRTKAAIAYNGGPGRVGKAISSLPSETRHYAYTKFPACYNKIISGVSPVNTALWRAMIAFVVENKGETFALELQSLKEVEYFYTREPTPTGEYDPSAWYFADAYKPVSDTSPPQPTTSNEEVNNHDADPPSGIGGTSAALNPSDGSSSRPSVGWRYKNGTVTFTLRSITQCKISIENETYTITPTRPSFDITLTQMTPATFKCVTSAGVSQTPQTINIGPR